MTALPIAVCAKRKLGDLTADAQSAFWRGLPSISLHDVATGASPQQSTAVKLAWDASELRILFDAIDVHPWATFTERDAPLFQEEVVEVFLDTVGDHECYFEIEVNPLNAVMDLVLRRNRSGYAKNTAWRCEGLRTAAKISETGWSAEFSIPFASLTSDPPSSGAEWRGNFLRIDRPKGVERELTAWSPTGLKNFHVPERFGILRFEGEAGI